MTTINMTPVVHSALGIKTEGFKTKEELLEMFMTIGNYMGILEEAQKTLRAKMFEVADKKGEHDEKGSSFIKMANGFGWKKEARNPAPQINYEGAMALMKGKGLNHRITIKKTIIEDKMDRVISLLENTAPEFVNNEEIVEDDDIEQAFIQQEISDEEFSSIVTKGAPTYALKMIKPK